MKKSTTAPPSRRVGEQRENKDDFKRAREMHRHADYAD